MRSASARLLFLRLARQPHVLQIQRGPVLGDDGGIAGAASEASDNVAEIHQDSDVVSLRLFLGVIYVHFPSEMSCSSAKENRDLMSLFAITLGLSNIAVSRLAHLWDVGAGLPPCANIL